MKLKRFRFTLVTSFFLLLVVFPLFIIFLISIVPAWGSAIPNKFGLVWWFEILEPRYMKAIINTIIVSLSSMIISVSYGIVGSYLFVFYDFRFKDFFSSMILSPNYVACMVISLGLLVAYPSIRNTVWIMVLGNFVIVSPLTMKYIQSSMTKISDNVVEASYSLGSSKINTFFKIILPLSRHGILGAIILSIGMCVSALSIMLLLYNANWITIPIYIYLENTTGNLGIAASFSVILIAISFVSIFFVNRLGEDNVD